MKADVDVHRAERRNGRIQAGRARDRLRRRLLVAFASPRRERAARRCGSRCGAIPTAGKLSRS